MRTHLKRGYIWDLDERPEASSPGWVCLADRSSEILIDRVGQYSLLCFLVRVLRKPRVKRIKK